ncbi:MAG TPA: BatA domain-containing protein, partial [Gemmatimonadaceae bacterium]
MTFLSPWALWAAGAVSAAVIALHILASKNPRVTPLPTARFIPDVPLRATARAMRLSDVLLLLLRVAAVMLVGVAFARPEVTRGRRAVGRVVAVDVSHALGSRNAAADSAVRILARGDVLIAFDSGAHAIRGGSADALRAALSDSNTRSPQGSISAALVAAMRAASSLRADADSVEIVLLSPLAAEEWDAATAAIRLVWPDACAWCAWQRRSPLWWQSR